MKINVDIKLTRGARVPEYATSGSAAVDLRAALEGGSVTIEPRGRARIPTGISISSGRDDVVAVIAGRSGLGAKHGISLANSSEVPFTVNDGDRVAQMMFLPVMHADFCVTDSLDETERGTGGFGSTGVQ